MARKQKAPGEKAPATESDAEALVPVESVIVILRGQRVILDAELARLYGVTTMALNQAVSRNLEKFPEDFSFVADNEEIAILKSQSVISKSGWGGRRKPPRAFTEHGAIMAANVLRSPEAVRMSVFVVRAFVRLRELVSTNAKLSGKLEELERRVDEHDKELAAVVHAIRALIDPPQDPLPRRRIGFHP